MAGCSGPISGGYDRLSDKRDIENYLIKTMELNREECKFNIADIDMLDLEELVKLPGVKNISSSYKQVLGGYDVSMSITYWDNYPIMYAYRNNDDTRLTDKQKELLEEYKRVLNAIENGPDIEKTSVEASSESSTESESESEAESESESASKAHKELTLEEKILKIHDYLVENVSYDANLDYMYNAYGVMFDHKAICSGYAEAFKTLVDMLGVECITITGMGNGDNHMWNMIKLDNEWYHVDVTWDDPVGNKKNVTYHTYFNVTDEFMEKDHTWDKDKYPKAEGTKYSYIKMMGIEVLNSQAEFEEYIAKMVKDRVKSADVIVYGDSDIKAAFSKMGGKLVSYSATISTYKDYKEYKFTIKY